MHSDSTSTINTMRKTINIPPPPTCQQAKKLVFSSSSSNSCTSEEEDDNSERWAASAPMPTLEDDDSSGMWAASAPTPTPTPSPKHKPHHTPQTNINNKNSITADWNISPITQLTPTTIKIDETRDKLGNQPENDTLLQIVF